MKSILERYYSGNEAEAVSLIEELGSFMVDYTNVLYWSKDIPDIDLKSARLFTFWAEDKKTKEIIVLCRGHIILQPFVYGRTQLQEYYFCEENVPYYPTAIFSSFRTTIQEKEQLDDLLDQVCKEVDKNWREIRDRAIETLDKSNDLWKRFVLSFDHIIHYSFVCPSIDRDLVSALKRKDFRISGVMEILSSPAPSYDQVTIESHLLQRKRIIEEYEKTMTQDGVAEPDKSV